MTKTDILWRVGVQFNDDGNETHYFQVVSENTLNCLAADLDEAAASKIVTALNSHAALVEALEKIEPLLEIAEEYSGAAQNARNIVRAALTLAKGA